MKPGSGVAACGGDRHRLNEEGCGLGHLGFYDVCVQTAGGGGGGAIFSAVALRI